jgi:hypothetical protein
MNQVFRNLLPAVLVICMSSIAAFAAEPTAKTIDVMVVGVFHMSDPGRDIHNLKAEDVLEPKRQIEIAAVTEALARFKPTQVGVEWPADAVAERYKQYLAGTLPASRNEVVQLGFRLAKTETRGFSTLLDAQNADVQREVDEQARLLSEKGLSADLRFLNDGVQTGRA